MLHLNYLFNGKNINSSYCSTGYSERERLGSVFGINEVLKIVVAEEGSEKVITHEIYYQENTFACLMIEAYRNEQALLEHLQLASPVRENFKVNWKVNRLDLIGDCSPETVNLWKQVSENGAFSFYNTVIES